MGRALKIFALFIGWMIAAAAALALVLYLVGPYEPADLKASFDASVLEDGVAPYLAAEESRIDGITPGVEKQVIWAGAAETETPLSILYIHGFSATEQEIRPVPDQVAEALGANLIYTRLTGHGLDGAALAGATVGDWMEDVAEGLAAARTVGERVLVMTVSTGGTLAAAAALDPELSQDVAGIVFVSPNFGINSSFEPLLTMPAARYWLPTLAGRERSFEPANEAQATYWTTRYPSVAVLPMAALVKKVAALDFSGAEIPALFWYSNDDTVVRPEVTARIASQWGGPVEVVHPTLGPQDDAVAHVVSGDILSPGQNDAMVAGIVDWADGL